MKDWNGYIRREDLENESGEVDMDKVRALSLNTYLRYIGDLIEMSGHEYPDVASDQVEEFMTEDFMTVTHVLEGRYPEPKEIEDCTNLKTVLMWGDPENIEKNTFRNCKKLTEISIPSSVSLIGESAFENCTSLRTALIWGDITEIGKNAFKNCSSLDDISIPSSCKKIGESAFQNCTDMVSVLLPKHGEIDTMPKRPGAFEIKRSAGFESVLVCSFDRRKESIIMEI